MIERGIGTAVAKSPMHIASGGPTSVASYFMRVSGIASRCYSCLIEIHTDSHHSYVRGYGLIHDSDALSKVIRRGLSIGVSQLDGTSFRLQRLAGQMGLIAQTGLIDSIGLAEGQPTRGAELSLENLLKQAFQLGVLIIAAKAKADRWVESIEPSGAFVLVPSM
jgi:hypothetical protein